MKKYRARNKRGEEVIGGWKIFLKAGAVDFDKLIRLCF